MIKYVKTAVERPRKRQFFTFFSPTGETYFTIPGYTLKQRGQKAPPESTQKGRTCMSNEYDYSGLYDHTSDGGAPRNSAQDQQPAETGSQNSYPNVGSSGMNTANTAPHRLLLGAERRGRQPRRRQQRVHQQFQRRQRQQRRLQRLQLRQRAPQQPAPQTPAQRPPHPCCGCWPAWAWRPWASAAVSAGRSWPAAPA